MSKFRTTTKGTTKTTNLAGGDAYKESPELELVSLLLTSFVQDKFYESSSDQLKRLKELVEANKDKKFIAQAAVYARKEFGMRSITHALIGELVKSVKGEKWTKNSVEKTVFRADDMLEMLAYYISQYGRRPIPNSLKKGLRDAIKKFDAYQLAKYKGSNSSVKMVDLFNIVHPKPASDKEKKVFESLMKGTLKNTETWESKISKTGQEVKEIEDEKEKEEKQKELKDEAWSDLIKNKKIGYFALLRNLRNIISDSPENLDNALSMLTDKALIKKSLVFPFRYLTAMKEIEKLSGEGVRKSIVAISNAIETSLDNVPKFPGKTLVVLDDSGSMTFDNSKYNGMKPMEIGAIFSSVLYKVNDADMMLFSDDARFVNLNPTDSILSMAKELEKKAKSAGTNFRSIFSTAKEKYDRIIIMSDMQCWMERDYSGHSMKNYLEEYKRRTGANPKIFSFDLAGYGTLKFPQNNVYCLAGFSDKVMDVMAMLEEDRNALVNKIKKIKI